MNILITGASGFIAAHLILFLKKNHNIYGLDLNKSNNTAFCHDVRKKLLTSHLPSKIDLIIFLVNKIKCCHF